MTKIEWVFEHDDFLNRSVGVIKKLEIGKKKKKGEFTAKDEWKIVNVQIRKKLLNPASVKGVCGCNSGILCQHRKKYLTKLMNEYTVEGK